MSYIKAYSKLFLINIMGVSTIYVVLLAYYGVPTALFAIYVSSLTALAGPISALINKKEKS